MTFFKIPLNPRNQKVTVKLGKKSYKLQTIYRAETWFLDIFDSSDTCLISAIPMVQGVDLLEQYQHVITGSLYIQNMNSDEQQNFSSLGREINLYWEDPE